MNRFFKSRRLTLSLFVPVVLVLVCVAGDGGSWGAAGVSAEQPPPEPPQRRRSALGRLLQSRQRTTSLNNLKMIALAMHNYHDVNRRFPPAVLTHPDSGEQYSWRVALLPFLEEEQLYREYRMDEPWDSEHNLAVAKRMPDVFRSPGADDESFSTGYFALVGDGTVWQDEEGCRIRDIRDGTSNTLMIVQAERDVPWTKPEDIEYDPEEDIPELGTEDGNQFLACMCDGSARAFSKELDAEILHHLIQRDDGNPIEWDRIERRR